MPPAGLLALSTKLLTEQGAIGRHHAGSFCNGLSFKPFRTDFLKAMSLAEYTPSNPLIGLPARDVLQENVILHAVRGRQAAPIRVSQHS